MVDAVATRDGKPLYEFLYEEMWFEQPQGMMFKVTVSMRNCTNDELLELARINWDANVQAGCTARSQRP